MSSRRVRGGDFRLGAFALLLGGAAAGLAASCGGSTESSKASGAGEGAGGEATWDAGAGGSTAAGGSSGGAGAGGTPGTDAATPPRCCEPVWVALDQVNLGGIAVDATSVYWTAGEQGRGSRNLMKAKLTGGPPEPVLLGEFALGHIAVRDGFIYWVKDEQSFDTSAMGTIWRMPLDGGPAVQVTEITDSTPFSMVEAFTVDATSVYWTILQARGTPDGDSDAVVFKAPIGGGAPVRLATVPGGVAPDIAVDATHVYWAHYGEPSPPAVMRVPIDGGATTLFATVAPPLLPLGVAVDGEHAYFTQFPPGFPNSSGADYQGTLLQAPLGGGPPVELTSRHAMPRSLVVSGGAVYWGTQSTQITTGSGDAMDGAVLRTTLDGVTTVVLEGMNPGRLATSGGTVCWTAARWMPFGGLGDVVCFFDAGG